MRRQRCVEAWYVRGNFTLHLVFHPLHTYPFFRRRENIFTFELLEWTDLV